jgi:hypothetical protein
MVRLGEVLDSQGRVIKARDPIWHPGYPKEYGFVYSRVTALVRDPRTGDIFLFRDRSEPADVYGTIGGHLDPAGKVRIRGRKKGSITPEEAIREQSLDEIGSDLTNIKRQPLYFGKTTRHSLDGTYIFTAELKRGSKIRLSDEIPAYIRLKSGGEATVFPATYDLIKGLAEGFDISNLKVYKGFRELLKERDMGYAERVKGLKEGKITNEQLAELEVNRQLHEAKERIEAKLKEEKVTPLERELLEERAKDIEERLREEETLPGKPRREYKVPGIEKKEIRAVSEKRTELKPEPRAEAIPEPKPEEYPQGYPEGYPQEYSKGYTTGYPKEYPRGYPKEIPKETRKEVPPEVPPVPPPEIPPKYPVSPGEKATTQERKRQEFAGAITWRQGIGWWAIRSPYRSPADAAFFRGTPPPNAILIKGGPRSAYRSIQTLTGLPPEKLAIDMGIFDILIGKPHRKPGEPGAIRFKKDIGQKTIGDITITKTGRGRPKVTRSTVTEGISVAPPIGNSRMPAAIAKQIGSVSAKFTSEGKLRLKVKRL